MGLNPPNGLNANHQVTVLLLAIHVVSLRPLTKSLNPNMMRNLVQALMIVIGHPLINFTNLFVMGHFAKSHRIIVNMDLALLTDRANKILLRTLVSNASHSAASF